MGWAIALHGGAGDISFTLAPELRQPREAALRHCLQIGVEALQAGNPALDVVELVVINATFFLFLIFFVSFFIIYFLFFFFFGVLGMNLNF